MDVWHSMQYASLSGHHPRDMDSGSPSHFGVPRQTVRTRSFSNKLCSGILSDKELGHGDHGRFGLSGGFGGVRGHYIQRNDWRSINPRSEGSFPQKHPGVQQQPADDFNFEQGIEEVNYIPDRETFSI